MNKKSKEQIFWGVFFVVAAVVLVLNQIGVFAWMGNLSIWKLLLTAILLVCTVKSLVHWNMSGAVFSVAFICIMYAKALGIEALSPWTILLAAVLLSIGLSMLFHKRHWKYRQKCFYEGQKMEYEDEYFKDIGSTTENQVNLAVSFGSSVKYINSDNFTKANLRCSFGALKVYLDQAVIQNGVADICIDASFSGVEIYIPRNWHVVSNIDFKLAGMEEKGKPERGEMPVLRLSGNVSCAGVTLFYI